MIQAPRFTYIRVIPAILVLVVTFAALVPFPAFADQPSWRPLVPCGREETPDCDFCHLLKLTENIINFTLFEIVFPFTVVMVAIGGFVLLFSGGNEDRVRLGKHIIWYAIVGFVVAFVAWIVVDSIITFLVNPSTFPRPWNEISCP